jgi:hypothetical protein
MNKWLNYNNKLLFISIILLNVFFAYIYHGWELAFFVFIISIIMGSAILLKLSFVSFGLPIPFIYELLLPAPAIILLYLIIKKIFFGI